MGINIMAKPDYSALFSSLGSASGSASASTFLSDYASIKNGSYYKLMKAYYGKSDNSELASSAVKDLGKDSANATAKQLAKVQTATDSLKEAADALISTDFEAADKEDIYKKVNSFVDNYNSVISSVKDSDNASVLSRTLSLIGNIKANENTLGDLGITIGEDNKLSLDKETFEKANMSTVESMFSGNTSFAYRVSAQASLIHFSAANAAAKSATYNFSGNYSNTFSSGNLFNTYF